MCLLTPRRQVDALAHPNEAPKVRRVLRPVATSPGCQWSDVSSQEGSGLVLYKPWTPSASSW